MHVQYRLLHGLIFSLMFYFRLLIKQLAKGNTLFTCHGFSDVVIALSSFYVLPSSYEPMHAEHAGHVYMPISW